MLFETSHDKSPTLRAGVRSPREEVVEFHVRYEDVYVVESCVHAIDRFTILI